MRTNVLAYHDVILGGDRDSSGFPGPAAAHYKLKWSTFVEHLDRIGKATARAPDVVDEVLAGGPAPGSWCLTFDDGGSSAIVIGEELARRGWRGHFFVPTDFVGKPGFVGRDDIRALHGLGQVIGSHSCSHPARMASRSWPELLHEWRRSRELLSDLLGEPVSIASIPGGEYSGRVAEAAAASGLQALCTSEPVSRVRSIDGCFVIGRYSVHREVDAHTAAAIAGGRRLPQLRQLAWWTTLKACKRAAPDLYLKARGALLARR
jgi:peptidoglycan/xylan/chitin deacetylase (PgdA/CDA1 family)